jgi:hypothetical protein
MFKIWKHFGVRYKTEPVFITLSDSDYNMIYEEYKGYREQLDRIQERMNKFSQPQKWGGKNV